EEMSGGTAEFRPSARVRRRSGIGFQSRRPGERLTQYLVQAPYFAEVFLLSSTDGLLGQIVAQYVHRVAQEATGQRAGVHCLPGPVTDQPVVCGVAVDEV